MAKSVIVFEDGPDGEVDIVLQVFKQPDGKAERTPGSLAQEIADLTIRWIQRGVAKAQQGE